MDLLCKICGYSLSDYSARIDFGSAYHHIFCPVCGNKFKYVVKDGVEDVEKDVVVEFSGVFYDELEGSYFIWVIDWNKKSQAENTVTQRFGALEVSVTGKTLYPYDICYQKVVVFQSGPDTVFPHHVVKPEYHHYLNPSADISGSLDQNKVRYALSLKGQFTATVQLPALVSKAETNLETGRSTKTSALNVWPDFERAGWNNYFFYFASTDPNVNLEAVHVIGTERREVLEGRTARGEVNFVPKLVELRVKDMAGVEYWSCYRVDLKEDITRQVSRPDVEAPILSVDFGTSNTCFAKSVASTENVEVIHFQDRTLKIVKGFSVEDSLNQPWFPEIQNNANLPTQLPSELSFYKETGRVAAEVQSLQPIVHYTIPPFTRYRDDEEKMILGKLKWKNALPTELSESVYELQYLYLSLAMRLALAELASDSRCQRLDRVDLIATCPLAFDEHQKKGFRDTIARVQHTIKSQVSIDLILQKTYDESHAGEAGSGQIQGTKETIYIDVGGGTTDIGYFRFENNDESETGQAPAGERETPVYLDSFQYAGDDVWSALADSEISPWKPTKLARETRAKGATAIFQDPQFSAFKGQGNNAHKGKNAISNFVDGLIEYTTRMIAARTRARAENEEPGDELGLYLLGNGWRFLEVLNEMDPGTDVARVIEEDVKSRVEARLQKYKIDCPPLKVIYPFLLEKNPKTVVALGAALLYLGEKSGTVVPEAEVILKNFLGSDMKVFGPEHDIPWHAQLPYTLPDNIKVKGLTFVIPEEFSFEQRVVDGNQIDKTNLLEFNNLRPVRRAGVTYVNKNLLAFYLEKWHKKMLVT
jgi:hypothetical protein